MDTIDRNVVIKYFEDGFCYLEIIELLKCHHNCNISLSTLKRWLRCQGFVRRPISSRRMSRGTITQVIREELEGTGSTMGYRRMHKTLLNKGILCRREDVRQVLKYLDPEGVAARKRRRLQRRKYNSPGPNYVWHIDGHDKLKPFGFSIHGCIDGFSRKLIWLEVGTTNKMPEVIARFYLDAVKKFGLPLYLKADNGTEHALIEPIHISLRDLDGRRDAFNSFSITTSPQNQRIEAYWSILQRDRIGWWKMFFNDLSDLDLFSNDEPVILDCIRFCFMSFIRKDLKSIARDWNAHLLSHSRYGSPTGRPDTMYLLPHLYDCENHSVRINEEDVDEFYSLTFAPRDFSEEFEEFAVHVMGINAINPPTNISEALDLYYFLLDKISQFS